MALHPIMAKAAEPWKPSPFARKCKYCGSYRPGMQPLKLFHKDGKVERGYWHLECFAKARKQLKD